MSVFQCGRYWRQVAAFDVPCVPVPQPRQRSRVIVVGGRSMTSNYTPARDPVNAYKAALQYAARNAYAGAVLELPLWVEVLFVFPRPKYLLTKSTPDCRLWCVNSKDVDNLLKSTFDALNGVLWNDDKQIVSATGQKQFAARGEPAMVSVVVSEASDKKD